MGRERQVAPPVVPKYPPIIGPANFYALRETPTPPVADEPNRGGARSPHVIRLVRQAIASRANATHVRQAQGPRRPTSLARRLARRVRRLPRAVPPRRARHLLQLRAGSRAGFHPSQPRGSDGRPARAGAA